MEDSERFADLRKIWLAQKGALDLIQESMKKYVQEAKLNKSVPTHEEWAETQNEQPK